MEIYNVTLLREGYVEIGETIQIKSTYTLNYSPFRYVALEHWMDIGKYPSNIHTIPTFVENFSYVRNITLDPGRFNVNETEMLYGNIKLDVFDSETSFLYSKQNESDQGIYIKKSKVNYTIIQQCPELILSSKCTNISFNFYNKNNKTFKLSDSYINFLLYAPNNSIVQNENLSTSVNGDINILLKTNSCKSGGNYRLTMITKETEIYNSTNHTIEFFVYNESVIFNVSISKNKEYVSVPYDPMCLELQAYLKFNSCIFWNSTFSSGEFIKKDNFTYISNLTVPYFKNYYIIDIWAVPTGTNSTLNRKVNLTTLTRPINMTWNIRRKLFSNKIKIKAKIFDNLTNNLIIDDQSFNFYLFSNSNWILIGKSKSLQGIVNLEWNLPSQDLEEKLFFKLELNNSSIYKNIYFLKEIILTEIKVLTIPEIKILDVFPLILKLQICNGTDLTNETIQIFINGFKIMDFHIRTDRVNLIILLAPSYEIVLNFVILYNGNQLNLNNYFVFQIQVRSNYVKVILGNSIFLTSIIISSIFLFLYMKNRKSNTLGKLKI